MLKKYLLYAKKIFSKGVLIILLLLIGAASITDRFLYYRPYNLIFITIDTMRADFLSCYNSKALPTPNIDQIAKDGMLFENAYCLIPITLPSHAVMMTSRSPHKANVFNNGEQFDGKVPTLAQILSGKGYATGAFVSLGVLKSDYGLNRGFTEYQNTGFKKRWYGTAAEVNGLALPWLQKNAKRPFFAWIHYSDPHEPYILADAAADIQVLINNVVYAKFCLAKKEKNMLTFTALPGKTVVKFEAIQSVATSHQRVLIDRFVMKTSKDVELIMGSEWKGRIRPNRLSGKYFQEYASLEVINRSAKPRVVRFLFNGKLTQSIDVIRKNYAAEVQYLDQYIGELLQNISKLNLHHKTVIVLTADHGESLGEHARIGHIYPLYTEITKVPLLIVYPGLGHKMKKNSRLVTHLDLMPTILDLLRTKSDVVMEGESLRRYVSWSPIDWMFSKGFNRQSAFASTYAPQSKVDSFSMIHGDKKMIVTGSQKTEEKIELYDLAKDPQESFNLVLSHGTEPGIKELQNSIHEYRKEATRNQAERSRPVLDEEEREMLRDLGYVN